jgi:pyridoxine kinase
MGRVLAISSQTVFGPVGNSAAVPALQEQGHEVLALPTVVLSNHPGHGRPAGSATDIPAMLEALNRVHALQDVDAVLTGYFSSGAQVIAVAKQIETLAKQNQALHVLVDPVIGDHGAVYVPSDVFEAIRDNLLPLATITTPNMSELQWLSDESTVEAGVEKLGVAETIVTSIPKRASEISTQLHVEDDCIIHTTPLQARVPNGTGDFLAGQYLAHRLALPPNQAFAKAMARVDQAVALSAGKRALQVARS